MNCERQEEKHRSSENRLMVARGEGVCGLGAKGEGIKKYKLVVIKESQGCEG